MSLDAHPPPRAFCAGSYRAMAGRPPVACRLPPAAAVHRILQSVNSNGAAGVHHHRRACSIPPRARRHPWRGWVYSDDPDVTISYIPFDDDSVLPGVLSLAIFVADFFTQVTTSPLTFSSSPLTFHRLTFPPLPPPHSRAHRLSSAGCKRRRKTAGAARGDDGRATVVLLHLLATGVCRLVSPPRGGGRRKARK